MDPLDTLMDDPQSALVRFLRESRSVHFFVADCDGKVQSWNAAFADRLKMTAAEIAARSVWDLLPEEDARSLRARIADAMGWSPAKFLLNLVDSNHCPFTLQCQLEMRPKQFMILGELPERTNAAAHEEMLRLNNDMAVLNREHARQRRELGKALDELEATHWHLKKMQEFLPICMECGRIKTASEWEDLLNYMKANASFLSHGYCPECAAKLKDQWGLPTAE